MTTPLPHQDGEGRLPPVRVHVAGGGDEEEPSPRADFHTGGQELGEGRGIHVVIVLITILQVSRQFKDCPWLKIPVIHWPLTTDRVLVMEYCPGGHVNDVAWLNSQNIDVHDVSRKIGELYSRMIFGEGYVHCDPHPGNVLVQKTASGQTQIVLLDHGLYTQLSNQFRYDYADFWSAIINRNVPAIKTSADKLGVGSLFGLFACMVTGRSWTSIQQGVDVAERSAGESAEIKANAAKYLKEITDVLAFVNR